MKLFTTYSRQEFITNNLKPNIIPHFFYREGGPTIIKKRYIDHYLNQKLFEINYLTDEYIDSKNETKIINYLKKILPDYDLVLVSDFGHGLITKTIIKILEKYSTRRVKSSMSFFSSRR